MTITTTQLGTLALLNAGYASEVQFKSSFVLSWAMTYKADGTANNNSGYSVGTLQSDLGQRPYLAGNLVHSYYQWAGSDTTRLVTRTEAQLTAVMKQQGRRLVANATSTDLSKCPLSTDELEKFNAFLQTADGRQAVWSADLTQISKLEAFGQRVMASQSYLALATDAEQAAVLTAAMKLYNQAESWAATRRVRDGDNLAHLMESKTVSFSDITSFITTLVKRNGQVVPDKDNYIKSGFKDAIKGADLYNKILTSNTPLSPWLQALAGQDLVALGQVGFASDPRFQVLERLFRNTAVGSNFVDSLTQGKPTLMLLPKGLEGQARIIGIDKSGQMFSADSTGDNFLRYENGQWKTSFGNYGRSELPIIKQNSKGKWILALGTEEVDLGSEGTALAQVNINGTDVTLDANTGASYAFDSNGDLGSMTQDGNRWVGTVLTGENKGKTYAFTDFNLDEDGSGIRNASWSGVPPIGQSNNYQMEINDGQGGVTTTTVKPIWKNVDGEQIIVGSESSIKATLNGVTQSEIISKDSTDLFTNDRTITTDTLIFDGAGHFLSHDFTNNVIDDAGLQLSRIDVIYDAQGGITQTSLTEIQPNGGQLTLNRDGQGNTLSRVDVQNDSYGNAWVVFIDASGTGTIYSYDVQGVETYSATITKNGGINGTTGTLTKEIDGKNVVFNVSYSDIDLNTDVSSSIHLTGINSIDGQPPVSDSQINAALSAGSFSMADLLTPGEAGGGTTPMRLNEVKALVALGDSTNAEGWTAALPNWLQSPDAQYLGGILTSTQSLLASIKTGKSLPLAVDFYNFVTSVSENTSALRNWAPEVNAANSLVNFGDALNRGDESAAWLSGSALAQYYLKEKLKDIGDALIAKLGTGATRALLAQGQENALANRVAANGTPAAQEAYSSYQLLDKTVYTLGVALSAYNVHNVFGRDGNDLGKAQAVSALMVALNIGADIFTPVGWALAAAQIGQIIFPDHDTAVWGDAKASNDAYNRTSAAILPYKDTNHGGEYARDALNSLIGQLSTHYVGTGKGIIAQRLPTVHMHYGAPNGQYVLDFQDPYTDVGQSRGFDADGKFRGDSYTDTEERLRPLDNQQARFLDNMTQQFLNAAVQAEAVAPMWMVKTVDAIAAREGPNSLAGLTTEQRAQRQGQLLGTDMGNASAGHSSQTARLIVLDLDNNGIRTTPGEDGSVLVDIDRDANYAEKVEWLSPREGILVLDRNGDGKISGGHEMFNDSNIDTASRGLHALDELDASGDGIIANNDFVYDYLRVWQDINHDGQIQGLELSSLASRGIASLEINNGLFWMNGHTQTMAATALHASSAGYNSIALGNSVLLESETGDKTVMVSALADLGQSDNAQVRAQHTHASEIYYQNNSFSRTAGGRERTFLLTKTTGHAANQSQWRNVA